MTKVFVYGTLKRGYNNFKHLLNHKDAKFIGEALTVQEYTMLNAGFPVLMEGGEQPARVVGEVFKVDNATLKNLDMLEGEGSIYDRKLVKVTLADGTVMQVSAYIGCKHWGRSGLEVWPALNKDGFWEWGRPVWKPLGA